MAAARRAALDRGRRAAQRLQLHTARTEVIQELEEAERAEKHQRLAQLATRAGKVLEVSAAFCQSGCTELLVGERGGGQAVDMLLSCF